MPGPVAVKLGIRREDCRSYGFARFPADLNGIWARGVVLSM